ncbi:MAG: polysaccharide biosynthesis/export family protein [Phycisphaerae bacterium]|nr:polysaccharide biosynthesis/export family protein [Phycisphaerae bacterium]
MNGPRLFGMLIAIAMLSLAAAGCEPAEPEKPEVPGAMLRQHWPPSESPVAHVVRRDYHIREGDSLEVIYHVRHQRNPSYHVKIQDVIVVRFPYKPTLNQAERVQSDGAINLDLIGKVYAFDRTIDDVEKELLDKYKEYIKDPVITVSFKESNVKIAELKLAITTAPRGQSRLVPVTPEGTISVPFVVSIRAAGKTVEQLHRDLNDAYSALGLDELEVTVNVQTVAATSVYVFGEVRGPGMLRANKEISLLQAIAQAGSYLPARAELSQVMLIRRRHMAAPSAAIINVYQLLENRKRDDSEPVKSDMGRYKYDIWLEDGDMVYVPTSGIAKRADYIEYVWVRGIRAVGGFTSTANYTAADAVDWLGPNP